MIPRRLTASLLGIVLFWLCSPSNLGYDPRGVAFWPIEGGVKANFCFCSRDVREVIMFKLVFGFVWSGEVNLDVFPVTGLEEEKTGPQSWTLSCNDTCGRVLSKNRSEVSSQICLYGLQSLKICVVRKPNLMA